MKKKIILFIICGGLVMSVVLPVAGGLMGVLRVTNTYAEMGDEEEGGAGDEDGMEVLGGESGDDDNEDGMSVDEDDEVPSPDETSETNEEVLPQLYIRAVNPGYKIDGVNNVGEMIEIARVGDLDTPVLLAGTTVSYTNSSGNTATLVEFPEYSWMDGESIILRLASSPGVELANLSYSKTLAMNAGLSLLVNGEVVDEVCWTGKEGCYKAFSSSKPTTLVRNLETGEFEHQFVYEPEYRAENYRVEEVTPAEEGDNTVVSPRCRSLQFSEILSYYESAKSEQFIEFYNEGASAVNLEGCKVRYKNKKYMLSGVIEPEGYFAYYPAGFSLTKNPVNVNKLELVDADEAVVDTMEYPNGQRKSTAYALLGIDEAGGEIWKVTYAPTPGAPNNYQEFKTCEAGKVINQATGNCVKVASVSEKICQEGYYLNILTGRCKKKTVAEAKTCKEGYYLNPETNRCRKIKENTGADYSVEPENYEENSSFIALYAVLGVAGVGLIYLGWEFRKEIAKIWRKILRKE